MNGPTQIEVNAEYAATNLNGLVTITTQGIQEWTVPASGIYSIEARGAQGGYAVQRHHSGGVDKRVPKVYAQRI